MLNSFGKKTVSTPKLELISEIAFNSMKQSFALKNFRPILPFLCSNQGEEQRFLNVLEDKIANICQFGKEHAQTTTTRTQSSMKRPT